MRKKSSSDRAFHPPQPNTERSPDDNDVMLIDSDENDYDNDNDVPMLLDNDVDTLAGVPELEISSSKPCRQCKDRSMKEHCRLIRLVDHQNVDQYENAVLTQASPDDYLCQKVIDFTNQER
jgi:hypothetical protein